MRDYSGWSDEQYVAWLAGYVQEFRPDFLSPFNEPGLPAERIDAIVAMLRSRLAGATRIAGPDKIHVGATLEALSASGQLKADFDIVDSHNANHDDTATAENWRRLVGLSGKPVWSSENPNGWSGIANAVSGGVEGLVVWRGKPELVNDAGRPSAKALELAHRLVRPGS